MAAQSFLYFICCICFPIFNAVREVSRILKRPSVRLQAIWGDEHKQGIVGVSRLLCTIIDENDQTGTVHTLPVLFRSLICCTILFVFPRVQRKASLHPLTVFEVWKGILSHFVNLESLDNGLSTIGRN